MKKRFLFLLLSLLLLTGCGGQEYRIDWEFQEGTLTIHDSTNGIIHRQAQWDEFADQVHTVVIQEGIYEIGIGAFRDMPNLTTAILHDKIDDIGDSAFRNTALVLDSLPSSLLSIGDHAFDGSSFELRSLPETLRSIGKYAFSGCAVPETLVIPERISSLAYAFAGSVGLQEVYLPESLMELDAGTFSGCSELTTVHFPPKVQELPAHYFAGCTSLTHIELPMYIREIHREAFAGCTALEEVILPERLEIIFKNAFAGCSKLENISFPARLWEIREEAFRDCTSLTQIHLPAGLNFLSETAFFGCGNLTGFTVDQDSAYLSADENGFLYNSTGKALVLIPPGVGGRVCVPQGVTEILGHSFAVCTAEEICLPDSVTRLDHGAFVGALVDDNHYSSLKRVYLPDSIVYTGNNLFSRCALLEAIYYEGTAQQWNEIENIGNTNERFSEYLVFDTAAP